MPNPRSRRRRAAFTLIELLVAISILAVLAGMTVAVLANLDAYQRAPAGASQLQQWLLIAKQRALRDRRPHGVRLIPDKNNPNVVRDLLFIEQPDDFAVQPGVALDPAFANQARLLPFRRLVVTGTANDPTKKYVLLEPPGAGAPTPPPDFSGGQGADRSLWPVQVGDYLEINGGGLPRRIAAIPDLAGQPGVPDPTQLVLDSPVPLDVPLTGHYRIVRTPRPAGDDPLALPDGVVIDLTTDRDPATGVFRTLPVDPLTGTIDILFAPSGAVIGRGVGAETVYLWVRDVDLPLYQGDNTIVAVYTRSGALAAHPVDPAGQGGGDPYSFTKDGRASGI